MNRLEFNTVLKTLDITYIKTNDYPNYQEDFYKFHELIISFCSGKYIQ